MNEPHELRERARRWLRWAQEDLALGEASASNRDLVARGACVWAQQAAEKALRALLVDDDVDPPKLHDLVRLDEMLARPVAIEPDDLEELSRWSLEGRYPADLDEATAADAQRAINTARRVLAEVALRVDPDPSADR